MKLVIAEKPSVAMALASVLGARTRKDGYVEGNGYIVSWCVGHLVGLCDASEYDEKYKKWRSGTAQGEQTASAQVAETNPAGLKTIPLEDVKIGVLYIGSASDTSGYTYAHELGIQGMVSNLGLKEDQVVRRNR